MSQAQPKIKRSLKHLLAVITVEELVRLIEHFGGLDQYIPQSIDDNHPLAMKLGRETADKLCDVYGREWLYVPRSIEEVGAVKRMIIDLDRANPTMRRAELARRCGCTERYVIMVLNGSADERQFSLL